jgi:ureidoglycolate hydrolase
MPTTEPTSGASSSPTIHVVEASIATPESFAPFGQLLAAEPHEATIAVRDGEEWVLNVLSYDHRPLVCDHLNAHHKATQMLVPLNKQPALVVVAPASTEFAGPDTLVDDLATVRAFVLDGSAAVNLAHGTWHWGPYPTGEHVDLLNLQGRGFASDNAVAHLERDLGVVVRVQL